MKKIVRLISVFALVFCAMETKAQYGIPTGGIAPDFTFTDITGKTQHLYAILAAGKTVAIDISSAWCGPCLTYHKSGNLKNFYNQYGPPGTNKATVFLIEGELTNSTAQLYGTSTGSSHSNWTQGDWVTGTPYPIIDVPNNSTGLNFMKTYMSQTFPTTYSYPRFYLICPNKITTKIIGQYTTSQWYSLMQQCAATSVNDIDLDSYVSVFPNPSAGEVFVDISALDIGQLNVKVYNVIGEVVLEMSDISSVPVEFKFDLNEQPNGLYFVEVKTMNTTTFKKVMLNK